MYNDGTTVAGDGTGGEEPWRMADRGLRLALAGDPEGFALYERALGVDIGRGVPVFLHVADLRRRGNVALADRLERLALGIGADCSFAAMWPAADHAKAVAEYRALFARGAVNSRMLLNCARRLALAGRAEELAALIDPARLLVETRIDEPAPDGRPLHVALTDALLRVRDRAEWYEKRMSVRRMHYLGDLDGLDPALRAALLHAVATRVGDYVQALRRLDHPLSRWLPGTTDRFECWALYSDGTGWNTPHIHHRAWVTAVYYPACDPLPEPGAAGALCIAPPDDGAPGCPGWLRASIQPVPGTLVIMPSFYIHHTEPLGRDGLRLSVPFDLLDTRADDARTGRPAGQT